MAELDHFAVLWQAPESTAAGVTVTCGTNHLCHLWLRYTLFNPWIHVTRGMERGAPLYRHVRYCFTSFSDVEQEEAGDTIHHTFLIAPWMIGETRWYYFLGTVSGVESPSRSAIFEYTRVAIPTTAYFYPDADPEVSSVDGKAARFDAASWYTVHAGVGNSAHDRGTTTALKIQSGWDDDIWDHIYRLYLVFDTSTIPLGSQILSASVRVHLYHRGGYEPWYDASYCIVYSWPTSNTAINPQDYQRISSTPLSEVHGLWDTLETGGYQTYHLNESGKLWVIANGITRLGLREYAHDCRNIPFSPFAIGKYVTYQIHQAESGGGTRPELKVTYKAP